MVGNNVAATGLGLNIFYNFNVAPPIYAPTSQVPSGSNRFLQINFTGSKSITQAIVYSVQDVYWAPSEPTDTMTFNNYGLRDFAVQGWDGSGANGSGR